MKKLNTREINEERVDPPSKMEFKKVREKKATRHDRKLARLWVLSKLNRSR